MFDISWGEIMMVGVVGMAVTGKQDLPTVFRFVGSQLGRVVGLLQGARARVDQYAAQNELRQLQNELRSGLRELDQVRMELAVAASSQGMMGRTLGVTTPSANRLVSSSSSSSSTAAPSLLAGPSTTTAVTGKPSMMMTTTTTIGSSSQPFVPPLGINSALVTGSIATPTLGSMVPQTTTGTGSAAANPTTTTTFPANMMNSSIIGSTSTTDSINTITLSSASHSEKAALEDEWEKQGIGYQTRAEQLYKRQRQRRQSAATGGGGTTNPLPLPASGSELLEALIKQNLLWDQYDRVVGEQDLQLQTRMAAIQQQKQQQQQQQALIQEIEEDEMGTTKKE